MLSRMWFLTILTVVFECIWSRAWSPGLDAPLISLPTTLLVIGVSMFTLTRWFYALRRAAKNWRTAHVTPRPALGRG
jgi:hypothetical protein